MNRALALAALLALSCAAGNRAARSEADAAEPKSFDLAAIDKWVETRLAASHAVGASLAIMREGQLVLVKGYGKASRETGAPVTPDTAFAVGSITKQFTCAAALLLAEDGKLSLDRKVAADYPTLTRASDISLLDLFQHVSGYPDFYPLDFVDRRMQHDIAPDALIAQYGSGKLDFEPGTRWSYCNTGYIIAGRMVERAAGVPIRQLFAERLFKPAGMTHTWYAPADTPAVATGYTSFALGDPERAAREPEGWLYTAGALYSTAADLARWDLALIEGKVLKPESWRTMTTPRLLASGRNTEYACGLAVADREGERLYGHSGAVSGFLAYDTFVPRTRSAVVLLVNGDDLDPRPIHRRIVDLLLQDEVPVPKIDGPPPREAALDLLHQLQHGRIEPKALGEEFAVYLTPVRLAGAAERLTLLGEPQSVEVDNVHERGGMESSVLLFHFATQTVRASLYRTPDGKVQQFLLYR